MEKIIDITGNYRGGKQLTAELVVMMKRQQNLSIFFSITVLFSVFIIPLLAQDEATTAAAAGSGGAAEAGGSTPATASQSPGRVMTIEDDDEPVLAGEKVYLLNAYLTKK